MMINSDIGDNQAFALPHVAEGMPPLEVGEKPLSFFEFWPTWLIYLPVAFVWLVLALRYRSLTLPLIANPSVPLSGMVGIDKSTILAKADPHAASLIAPWVSYTVGQQSASKQVVAVQTAMTEQGFGFPIVGKPEIGCRGVGVKLLKNEVQLKAYLQSISQGVSIVLQKLAPWEAEAGVFYVRRPGEKRGQVTSLTLKYSPYVVGDGVSTLEELVLRDERAGKLKQLYISRHKNKWHEVVPKGEHFRLVFSASHSKGAIFRDGRDHITQALTDSMDKLFDGLPDFYFGRLDVKFRSLDALKRGKDFMVLEINGASSEALHIWDRDTTLRHAVATLVGQYKTLFELGHENRRRGHEAPGILALLKAWRRERNLVAAYPEND